MWLVGASGCVRHSANLLELLIVAAREPLSCLPETKNCFARNDAHSATHHFLNRILNSAMAIRRQ